MGTSQSSSRKLSIPNEENTGVIKVSDSVVKRLKGNAEDEGKEDGSTGPSDDKEDEIRQNDQYWEQRLLKLQENHRNVNKVLEEEYDKAVREVSDRFQNFTKNSTPPCQDMKGCVVECYKKYPQNTLACSPAVQAYSDCVDASRRKVIARS